MENWKPIPEAPAYEISDLGNVRRADRLISKSWNEKKQCLSVQLFSDGKRLQREVHRLVAEAFIPALAHPSALVVLFRTRDHRDCRPTNLVWAIQPTHRRKAKRGRYSTGLDKRRSDVA